MMPLPIVGRELRVAARRPLTYFSRPLAVFGVVVILGFFSFGLRMPIRGQEAGKNAFVCLVIAAALYSLIEAIRTAADCLCREKREGTLGLLFLTDLNGFDVVAGKLAAAALNSLYGLLAMVPILTVTLSMGGLKWGDVAREAAALLNWIFYAYAVVMWSSARAKSSYHAVTSAMGWIFAFAFVPLLMDAFFLFLAQISSGRMDGPVISTLSPLFSVGAGFPDLFPYAKAAFVFSLLVTHVFAWLFLLIAAARIRKQWELAPEPVREKSQPPRSFAFAKTAAAVCLWKRERRRERNPIIWLSRRRMGSAGGWLVVLGMILLGAGIIKVTSGDGRGYHYVILWPVVWIFPYLLYGVAVLNAGRLFVEVRENGAWEWLNCTSLSPKDVIAGQWRALRPMCLRLALAMALLIVAKALIFTAYAQGDLLLNAKFHLVSLAAFGVKVAALIWVSLWFALRSKGLLNSTAKSLLVIVIVPELLSWFFSQVFFEYNYLMRNFAQEFIPLSAVLIGLFAYNFFWIRWARKNLRTRLREVVASQSR